MDKHFYNSIYGADENKYNYLKNDHHIKIIEEKLVAGEYYSIFTVHADNLSYLWKELWDYEGKVTSFCSDGYVYLYDIENDTCKKTGKKYSDNPEQYFRARFSRWVMEAMKDEKHYQRVKARTEREKEYTEGLKESYIKYCGIPLLYPSLKKYSFFSKEANCRYNFRLRSPLTKKKCPLVIYFHAAGPEGKTDADIMNEAKNAYLRLLFHQKHFYMLVPQLPPFKEYNTDEHSELTGKIIDYVVKIKNIDVERIYVFGASYGAYNTLSEIWRHPNRYAAAVFAVGFANISKRHSGCYPGKEPYHTQLDDEAYQILERTPMCFASAEKDDNVTFSDHLYERFKRDGADTKYYRYKKGDHHIHARFFRTADWEKWVFSKRKPKGIS